jgi:hypothetical protein
MKKLLTAATAMAVIGLAPLARAEGDKQGGTGGSGQMGQMGEMGAMGGQEVSGKVLSASRNQVTIQSQDGAAIPFEVQKDTSFQGVQSARELQEGQQVRANFELSKDNKNQLKSIEVVPSGSGGAGGETPSLPPGQGGSGMESPQQPPPEPQPTEPGTGGSGMEEQPQQDSDLGGSGSY